MYQKRNLKRQTSMLKLQTIYLKHISNSTMNCWSNMSTENVRTRQSTRLIRNHEAKCWVVFCWSAWDRWWWCLSKFLEKGDDFVAWCKYIPSIGSSPPDRTREVILPLEIKHVPRSLFRQRGPPPIPTSADMIVVGFLLSTIWLHLRYSSLTTMRVRWWFRATFVSSSLKLQRGPSLPRYLECIS